MRSIISAVIFSIFLAGVCADQKYVFAHYMIGYANTNNPVAFYQRQISAAIAWNIDGFALNMGSDAHQPAILDEFFTAADGFPNFKLFLSFDMSSFGANSASTLKGLVETYYQRPSYHHYQGKPFVSTFSGEQTDLHGYFIYAGNPGYNSTQVNAGWAQWKASLNTSIYFCPSFTAAGPSYNIYERFPVMDCHFAWDMWAQSGGDRTTTEDAYYQTDAQKNGKQWMAGASPNFFVHIQQYSKNWVWGSERLYPQRWSQLIQLNPDMVEIATWNDYSESHYIINPEQTEVPGFCSQYIYGAATPYNSPVTYDHTAFGNITSYYAQWYKTGSQPVITQDQFYWWFRPHPKAQYRNDTFTVPNFSNTPDDSIYFHTITKDPSLYSVSVTVNGSTTVQYPSQSKPSFAIPFSSNGGSVTVTILLAKNQSVLFNTVSPLRIEPNGNYSGAQYNYNFLTSSWSQPTIGGSTGTSSGQVNSGVTSSTVNPDTVSNAPVTHSTVILDTTNNVTRSVVIGGTTDGSSNGMQVLASIMLEAEDSSKKPGIENKMRLLVKAGPNEEQLSVLTVNHEGLDQFEIKSEHFEGRVALRIVGFKGVAHNGERPIETSPYFDNNPALNSIQIQGRFKGTYKADEIVWGNQFEKPLNLPWGSSMAIKIAQKTIDPTLEVDTSAARPWAFSPFIVSMNKINVKIIGESSPLPAWPNPDGKPITEDTDALIEGLHFTDAERKSFFTQLEHRKDLTISPDQVWNMDFYNPYIDFQGFTVTLPAIGFKVDVMKYYNNQALKYVLKTRDNSTVFFVITMELVE
ncbi:glucan endo-1,3-alpha-glucosidase Agn1 [Planoprotostelium fungivorum]|uniref:Glucan endo-1,3-alpha-glucosidase Agn1 n=1 Tax=Planoprotostelium fungivorum TaxID=1890364 RepID=A0A2P6NPJ1_9EUKA|nr:glucan endo-1,3-alpha-glucosidase Agn1 [Planoprotostelium fungivorum]